MPVWLANACINERGSVRSGWKALGFFLLLAGLGAILAGLKALGLRHGLGIWMGVLLGALASYLCVRLEGRSFSSLGFLPGRRS